MSDCLTKTNNKLTLSSYKIKSGNEQNSMQAAMGICELHPIALETNKKQ